MITVLVLTHNEEKNLATCLKSAKNLTSEVVVVDSHSTDNTKEIAEMYGARFYEHDFENQADQTNWALGNLDLKGEWILRLDADEYLSDELIQEIKETLPKTNEEVTGFEIKRRVHFLGKWVRHGGYYPTWHLRLWRKGKGAYDEREVDERVMLFEGRSERLKNDFVDDNKKGLDHWIQKHIDYANREVKELLKEDHQPSTNNLQLYYRLPMFWRARLYYWYRLIIKLGFLDKREGRLFHYLQGYWYRMLVDTKLYEFRRITNPTRINE